MKSREHCSHTVVLMMLGCQENAGRKRSEFCKEVKAISGIAPLDDTMGCRDAVLARKRGYHLLLGERMAHGFRCRFGWNSEKVPIQPSIFSMTQFQDHP